MRRPARKHDPADFALRRLHKDVGLIGRALRQSRAYIVLGKRSLEPGSISAMAKSE